MAAAFQNGREHLLVELLPKILDDNLWDKITRDLLEHKDRHHLWRLKLQDRFAKLTKDELDRNCYNWTLAGTGWLQQIVLDIRFAKELFGPDEWDPNILQDFMNLLTLTLQLFQGKEKYLGKVKEHCRNFESKDIVDRFDEWRTYANQSLLELVHHLHYHERENWDAHNLRIELHDDDKVPGATFVELLIRNEIQNRREKIIARPVHNNTQQDRKHVSGRDHAAAATIEICTLTRMAYLIFLTFVQPIFSLNLRKFIAPRRSSSIRK